MRALVVYCHPVPESFCAAVRDAVVETIAARGCEARRRKFPGALRSQRELSLTGPVGSDIWRPPT